MELPRPWSPHPYDDSHLTFLPEAESVGRVLVSGGGRHNAALMAELARRMGVEVAPIEALDLDGDMIEAQAFGFLAVRVARGMPTSAPGTTGVGAAVGGGQIARPATRDRSIGAV